MPDTAGPYAAAAWQYRQAGWAGVIPIGRRAAQKDPPPTGYTGYAGIDPSGADVQAWIDGREGTFNIGLHAPQGVLIIDVDERNGGAEGLKELERRAGVKLPPTITSTARGANSPSRHYIYRATLPEGRVWRDHPAQGLDSIHVGHRYAVVWPSLHPGTGTTYETYDADGELYEGAFSPGDLAELPAELIEECSKPGEPMAGEAASDTETLEVLRGFRVGEPCPRVTKKLTEELERISKAASASLHDPGALFPLVAYGIEEHAGVGKALSVHQAAYVAARVAHRSQSGEAAGADWWRQVRGAVGKKLANDDGKRCRCDADQPTPRKAQTVATEPVHLGAARAVFSKWLHIDDDAAMLYVAATIAANNAEGDPLWTLLVGPPSAGKTEIAMSTAGLPYVHPAATITESALMSGVSRKEHDKGATGGLLKKIGSYGIILAKDFTSVLSQNKDTAASALAALREVYDGSWFRPVGTGGGRVLTWEGKVGLLGCVTPSIDRFAQVVGALGDRYLLLRLPDADPRSMAAAALSQGNAQKTMRAELAEAMTGLILGADLDKVGRELGEDEQERLIRMAEYTARARTTVERNTYTREVEVIPQPEGTARLVGQMRRLYGGLEAIGCPPGIAWGVVERVSRDCVPAIRTRVIELLLKVDEISTAKVAESLRIDWKTAQRHLEDLRLLDLSEVRIEEGKTNTSIYWHRATEWLHEHRP